MENSGKTVLWVIVALIVLGGIYYYWQSNHAAPQLQAENAQSGTSDSALASGSDTSDTALQQDLAGMDTQFSAMQSDTADIDSSMNDTAVAQDSSF